MPHTASRRRTRWCAERGTERDRHVDRRETQHWAAVVLDPDDIVVALLDDPGHGFAAGREHAARQGDLHRGRIRVLRQRCVEVGETLREVAERFAQRFVGAGKHPAGALVEQRAEGVSRTLERIRDGA